MGRRYKAVVAYDGTAYAGWQVQPDQPTVQGHVEQVLHKLTGESPRVECSGRTDSGVHARGQVAHFDLAAAPPAARLKRGMNALLAEDIRIMALRPAAADFHARFSAAGKEYRYFIWNGPDTPPWLRLYRAPVYSKLEVAAMRTAAAALIGEHDFAAFSANPNREIDGTVRELRKLQVLARGPEITIVAQGNGFLYRMVRSLAGFLIRVGRGELPPDAAAAILASKTRTARVPTAPAQGLFLWRVFY